MSAPPVRFSPRWMETLLVSSIATQTWRRSRRSNWSMIISCSRSVSVRHWIIVWNCFAKSQVVLLELEVHALWNTSLLLWSLKVPWRFSLCLCISASQLGLLCGLHFLHERDCAINLSVKTSCLHVHPIQSPGISDRTVSHVLPLVSFPFCCELHLSAASCIDLWKASSVASSSWYDRVSQLWIKH